MPLTSGVSCLQYFARWCFIVCRWMNVTRAQYGPMGVDHGLAVGRPGRSGAARRTEPVRVYHARAIGLAVPAVSAFRPAGADEPRSEFRAPWTTGRRPVFKFLAAAVQVIETRRCCDVWPTTHDAISETDGR